ncbi:MAG: hypothetical protein WC936_01175 [Candidatus Nanoarchaeia archaeon]
MKLCLKLNLMHHFYLFLAFMYWLETQDTWNAFTIMGISVCIGYFMED